MCFSVPVVNLIFTGEAIIMKSKPLLICYGDSNTFGYDPRSWLGDRYDPEDRWVDILGKNTGWDVRNQGMNGRRIPGREVVFSHSAHKILLMLGSNDLLQGDTAAQAAQRMETFLLAMSSFRKKLILLCPPPFKRGEWVSEMQIHQSREYCAELEKLADKLHIPCINTALWDIPLCFDGVHFTAEGHRLFAVKLVEEFVKLTDATDG